MACKPPPPPPVLGSHAGTNSGGVSGSGSQPPGTPRDMGTPQHTYLKKDPHDTLIILNIHNWG